MHRLVTERDLYQVYPRAEHDAEVKEAVVLDIALHRVLFAMYPAGLFEKHGLVFKGGTAIRKFQLGHKARFSFDLDFTLVGGRIAVRAALADIARVVAEIPGADISLTIDRRRGRILLVTSELLPVGVFEAKIDVFWGTLFFPTAEMAPLPTPIHDYGWCVGSFTVPVIHVEENIVEKLRRWHIRAVTRDLADLAAQAAAPDQRTLRPAQEPGISR